MVAEKSTADAAKKKYARSPLLLTEFYKAHALYPDAAVTIDRWLAQHPTDAQARRMKEEIEKLSRPAD